LILGSWESESELVLADLVTADEAAAGGKRLLTRVLCLDCIFSGTEGTLT